jgi:hypothetical protein
LLEAAVEMLAVVVLAGIAQVPELQVAVLLLKLR